jgi:hypothetical protein
MLPPGVVKPRAESTSAALHNAVGQEPGLLGAPVLESLHRVTEATG